MAVEDSNQGNKNIFGLSQGDRSALLFRLKRSGSASVEAKSGRTLDEVQWRADPKMTKFEALLSTQAFSIPSSSATTALPRPKPRSTEKRSSTSRRMTIWILTVIRPWKRLQWMP